MNLCRLSFSYHGQSAQVMGYHAGAGSREPERFVIARASIDGEDVSADVDWDELEDVALLAYHERQSSFAHHTNAFTFC